MTFKFYLGYKMVINFMNLKKTETNTHKKAKIRKLKKHSP